MYQYQLPRYLPTADELPNSDDTPVDNELQEIIPNLLKSILRMLWKGRMDWFFGIDMGIYTHPEQPPIVPDGFLSLNVERSFDEDLRLSYLLWEEEIPPILVLEVVSAKPGGEYTTKLDKYAELGVLYYVIYNPKRRRKARLEIHKLVNGNYELQNTNPLWMPEIGLGIGCERASYDDLTREWLYWYDENDRRYPTPYEQIEQERQRADNADRAIEQERQQTELERQRADRLAAKLRDLGIDPD
ncbi:Uma2 family endonuclease [Chamaesiphon sp.]|uniref:Uma2 family endonuclease n=1 Tax=Chamaesiphon sp. TaxID=2814140 RepID=UPI003592EF55